MYADLIFPFSLPQVFTYGIPAEFQSEIVPGIRVVVQFGARRLYSALVYKVHSTPPQGYETKDIISVLDSRPVVNEFQIEFWKWISEYYMCSLGEVMKASLPAGLKLESETRLIYNPDFQSFNTLSDKESMLLSVLEERSSMTISDIAKVYNKRDLLSLIKLLIEKQAIFAEEHLREGHKPKLITYIKLATAYHSDLSLNEAFNNLKRAPKQADLLTSILHLLHYPSGKPVEFVKQDLLKETNASPDALQSLIKKGILEVNVREINSPHKDTLNGFELKQLHPPQQEALEHIRNSFNFHKVVLLYGVTSSGKTEIYFHLIAEELQKGRQVLYLLPEIALTAQMIDRLTEVFGDCIGVYHSKYSDSERTAIWQEMLKGSKESRYRIILGVRSSILLPFSNLGLIIVDEEHENTFKQFDPAPRYHARDSAIVLANFHDAKVLLGTATPSMETYNNARTGKFGLVKLESRYMEMEMPSTEIVDVRRARKKKQMQSHFHPVLIEHIHAALQAKEQVILFQNRRGFSPYMQCNDCGDIPRCKYCDVSLTYHKGMNQLTCHYCGYSIGNIGNCRACGSNALKIMGFGTEKIEEEIEIFVPGAKVARLDMDTTRSRKSYEKILSDFDAGDIDILVGTQMVTKGLDFKNVSLVGILDADHLLNYPDFRAYERSYQLMAQVSGRAGRRNKQGKVIIQTTMPEHPIIVNVVNNAFESIYNTQLSERKNFHYPPFSRLVQLVIKHRDATVTSEAADWLATKLRTQFIDKVFGPEFMIIPRIQNLYQKQILIKIPRNANLQEWKGLMMQETKNLQQKQEFKTVQLTIDVDPM
jgi:primosomal protein N' (replication factor Y) (superfamily II helicase)